MIVTGWCCSQAKAAAPRVGELVTLDDFLLQLVKGRKRKPLQNLKILEYILQFPGLYAASCKCYNIISSPWKTELYERWRLWDFCYLGVNTRFMLSLLLMYFLKRNTEKARCCSVSVRAIYSCTSKTWFRNGISYCLCPSSILIFQNDTLVRWKPRARFSS